MTIRYTERRPEYQILEDILVSINNLNDSIKNLNNQIPKKTNTTDKNNRNGLRG